MGHSIVVHGDRRNSLLGMMGKVFQSIHSFKRDTTSANSNHKSHELNYFEQFRLLWLDFELSSSQFWFRVYRTQEVDSILN